MSIPPDAIDEIEAALGHRFEDRNLLVQALTHTSWIEERWPGGKARDHDHESQERLEFLGDAFLGWIVGRWCYLGDSVAGPDRLTDLRTMFTKGDWLTAKGHRMGFEPFIRRGSGESQNALLNRKIVEDTLEALIGAVLIDPAGGPLVASEIVQGWLPDAMPEHVREAKPADPISAFNEWHTQTYHRTAQKLAATRTGGRDHDPVFTCVVEVGEHTGTGTGRSGQEARRAACRAFLDNLTAGGNAP